MYGYSFGKALFANEQKCANALLFSLQSEFYFIYAWCDRVGEVEYLFILLCWKLRFKREHVANYDLDGQLGESDWNEKTFFCNGGQRGEEWRNAVSSFMDSIVTLTYEDSPWRYFPKCAQTFTIFPLTTYSRIRTQTFPLRIIEKNNTIKQKGRC